MTPDVGAVAPALELPGADGATLSLAALKGRKVVLFFYPKDDTSGCTQEAKEFSALQAEFAKADAAVIGVSPGGVASKARFVRKHGLAVALAADEERAASQSYGVWVEKSLYGRKYMGVERTTFLIDRDGTVAQVWPKVKVPGHAAAVLEAARALAP